MGSNIWTDGENIYFSNSSSQYVLDKSTSTWNTKTWTGLTSFIGSYVWTDGENIYYSLISNQYVLDLEETTVQEAIDDLKINTGSGGDSVPIGLISPYPASTPPHGWLLCDGSAVSRTTYKELFDVIGTTHGSGDGSTTFNLPDMPSYTIVGVDANDSNFDAAGKKYGSKNHVHQMTIGQATYYGLPLEEAEYGLYIKNQSGVRSTSSGAYRLNAAPMPKNNNQVAGISTINHDGFAVETTGETYNSTTFQPSIAEYYMIKAFKVSVPGNDLGDTLPIGSVIDYDGDTVPDGYEIVDDLEYIVAYNSSNRTLTHSYVILSNFVKSRGNGTKLTIYNGKVKVGKDIHIVRIDAKIRVNNCNDTNYYFININGSNIQETWTINSFNAEGTATISLIYPVNENDIISLNVYGSGVMETDTTLTVEKLN